MIIISFSRDNRDEKFCFFEETFSLIDINIDVTSGIAFLTLNYVKLYFNN